MCRINVCKAWWAWKQRANLQVQSLQTYSVPARLTECLVPMLGPGTKQECLPSVWITNRGICWNHVCCLLQNVTWPCLWKVAQIFCPDQGWLCALLKLFSEQLVLHCLGSWPWTADTSTTDSRQSAALSMRYTVLKRQQRLYINTAKSPCMLSNIASTYKPTTGFPVRTLSVMICVWFWAPTVGNVKERLQCYIAKLYAVSGHQADAGMAALPNVDVIEYLTSWKSILPSLLLSWSWIMRLMSIRSQWSPFWWVTLAKSCSEISPSLSASSAAKLRSRISSFL